MEFTAHFRIESGTTTVTGTKELAGAPSFLLGQGTCTNFEDLTIQFGTQTIVDASGTYVNFHGDVKYEAMVTSSIGTSQFEGLAFAQGQQMDVSGTCVQIGQFCERHLGSFRETFVTSQPKEAPVEPGAVRLAPKAATNEVGTTHTVTATVVGGASAVPVAGVTVRFVVTGSTSAEGSCSTGTDGTCSFTYQGPELPGADLITAFVDQDNDETPDPGVAPDEATKAWVGPAPTPGHVTGGGQFNADFSRGVTFGFIARNFVTQPGMRAHCNVIDHRTRTTVRCLDITAIVQTATHATFFGNALVNGDATTYRIDVDDLGEGLAGLLQDTFKIQTDNGYAAGGFLTQGNIQIHPLQASEGA